MSLVQAKMKYDQALADLKNAEKRAETAHKALIKAESNLKFKCVICKKSSKYKDVTLLKDVYTERPLGWGDDYTKFSEWQIECPHCLVRHRFLSEKSQDTYGIPYRMEDHFGRQVRRQQEYNTGDFAEKFKCVREQDDRVKKSKFVNL